MSAVRVFISYASSEKPLAKRLTIALRQELYDVFFDDSNLREGAGYNEPIRQDIAKADILVFLATADALASGRYTMTELRFAEDRWPNPDGHVLPVVVPGGGIDPKKLPPYLGLLDPLIPIGDVVAETLAKLAPMAAAIRADRRRRLVRRAMVGGGTAAGLGALAWVATVRPWNPPCYLAATFDPTELHRDGGANAWLTVSGGHHPSDSVPVEDRGVARFQLAHDQLDHWSLELLDGDGGRYGPVALSGCPKQPGNVDLGANLRFRLGPR